MNAPPTPYATAAEHWAELSAALRVQARDPLKIREARYRRVQGLAADAVDEHDEAIAHATAAKELYERAVGPDHWLIARMHC